MTTYGFVVDVYLNNLAWFADTGRAVEFTARDLAISEQDVINALDIVGL